MKPFSYITAAAIMLSSCAVTPNKKLRQHRNELDWQYLECYDAFFRGQEVLPEELAKFNEIYVKTRQHIEESCYILVIDEKNPNVVTKKRVCNPKVQEEIEVFKREIEKIERRKNDKP